MNILTLENTSYNLNTLPESIDEDIRFSVLDNNIVSEPDFFFVPLIFLESFSAPAMVLSIGKHQLMMPVNWHIAVGCSESGNDLEILPLTSINDRGFEAFLFNPLTSFKADFAPIQIENFYTEIKWYAPRAKTNQLLSIPLTEGDNPPCAYFARDISKQNDIIDYSNLF